MGLFEGCRTFRTWFLKSPVHQFLIRRVTLDDECRRTSQMASEASVVDERHSWWTMRSIRWMAGATSFLALRLPLVNQHRSPCTSRHSTLTVPCFVRMVARFGFSFLSRTMDEMRAINEQEPDTPAKARLALCELVVGLNLQSLERAKRGAN